MSVWFFCNFSIGWNGASKSNNFRILCTLNELTKKWVQNLQPMTSGGLKFGKVVLLQCCCCTTISHGHVFVNSNTPCQPFTSKVSGETHGEQSQQSHYLLPKLAFAIWTDLLKSKVLMWSLKMEFLLNEF